MYIEKLIVKNYRTLRNTVMDFAENLNIIVADNESGKSTVLEAINLALTGQLNGKSIMGELHPFLFNKEAVDIYVQEIKSGTSAVPPKIEIEVFFNDSPELKTLKGSINSLKKNCPGVSFIIEFDESFSDEYADFIKDSANISNVPTEYYSIIWRSFAFANITSRSIPIYLTLIDASMIKHNLGANKYLIDAMKIFLSRDQKVQLSTSYRKMKDFFLNQENVVNINQKINETKGHITNKKLSISLDSSSKSNWQNSIETRLDEIPLSLAGKGEQNSIKIKLAMETAKEESHLFLIEEPENHLSFTNLNKLIKNISDKSEGKQLIITTHSSYVLNKLGIGSVILFRKGQKSITLNALSTETKDYFLKLPGHQTLRLILAEKCILVEGPSDELIIQKAFQKNPRNIFQCNSENNELS